MTWLYNIYHGSILSDHKVTIDSNARIKSCLEAARRKASEEKRREERMAIDSFIASLPRDDSDQPVLEKDQSGNYIIPAGKDGEPLLTADENGHPLIRQEEEACQKAPDPLTEETISQQRDQILSEARQEADQIIAKAKEEADGLFENTAMKAQQKGYNDGLVKGQAEYQEKLDAVRQRENDLDEQYQRKAESLEKDVLDAVIDVVSKAFDIEYSDDSGLLLKQIDNCLNHIEHSKNILIRVNEKNYSLLQSKKDLITDKLGDSVNVELAKDPLLSDGSGMIETDGGVYDVSIDTEFSNLIKRIRLLSI